VQDTARVWQVLHEQARAAGVIEMNVRQEDVVNIRNVKVLLSERVEQQRYRVVRARIDERGVATFHDQVARVLQWAQVFGIDGNDAIVEGGYVGALTQVYSGSVVSRPSSREK
jgi:hypothetical protein